MSVRTFRSDRRGRPEGLHYAAGLRRTRGRLLDDRRRVSPGSSSCRCAHHGAMPLVITRSWNSRRLNALAARGRVRRAAA